MTVHVVHFSGPVTQGTLTILQSCCLQACRDGATRIRLHLASQGGANLYGFAVYNFLRTLPVPVDTHNLGGVNSMANIIYLAGENRTASPKSRFLLHPLHWNFAAGDVDQSRLTEYSSVLDDDRERYIEIFNERTASASAPFDIRQCLNGTAHTMNPEAALAAGITHSVVDPVVESPRHTWWGNT